VSLKKYKFQGKAVEATVSSKEQNTQDFCLNFVQEFGLCKEEKLVKKSDFIYQAYSFAVSSLKYPYELSFLTFKLYQPLVLF
jgi:hypothetical protein